MSEIDTNLLGVTTAELMGNIEEAFAEWTELTIDTVMVIAEVNGRDEDGDLCTEVYFRCSDGRRWLQAGLADHVADYIRARMNRG